MSTQLSKRNRLLVALLLMAALCATMIGATTKAPFPEIIPLPNGFNPEGIASGEGTTFYVGSVGTGAIYRGDLRTGEGEVLVPAEDGGSATGVKYDPRSGLLFVSGATTGMAFVYNGETGETVAVLQLSTGNSFINDVVITVNAAYFTDSFAPVLYKVALDPTTGEIIDPTNIETITLSGDYVFVAGGFNANGIDASPNGKTLLIVNSTTGNLYLVDPTTGVATLIDLSGDSVPSGDGILLQGKTLYVVQNFLNQVAVIKLSPDYSSGEIVKLITSPDFRVPTTIAAFGTSL
jgi:sugar lactone lactonase YvrE